MMTIETVGMSCPKCGAALSCETERMWRCDYCGMYTLVNYTKDTSYQGEIGYTFVYNFVRYRIISVATPEVAVTECDPGLSGEVVIPTYVNFNMRTYKVVELSFEAFRGCDRITSLVLPEFLRTIGVMAFECARVPDGFAIPDTVEAIGNSAFARSTNLRSVRVPPSVRTIGDLAFSECIDLESVELSEGLETMGIYVFFKSMRLGRVTIVGDPRDRQGFGYIPRSVRNLGKYTFDRTGVSYMHLGKDTVYDHRQTATVIIDAEVAREAEKPKPVRIDAPPEKKGRFSRFRRRKLSPSAAPILYPVRSE